MEQTRTTGEAEQTLAPEQFAAAVRTFRDAGLVTFEDALELDFLRDVRAACDTELAAFLEAQGGLKGMEGRTFGHNHVGFFPAWAGPLADARLLAHPIVVQMLTALLGENFTCSFYNTNTAFPDSGIQPVHRDSGPLFGTEFSAPTPPTHIVLNVPLCPFTLENGSTELWPGTHLIVDSAQAEAKMLETRARAMPSARLNLGLGGIALRDLRLWHRGMPNGSDTPRTMLAIVYQREWLASDTVTVPRATWESWPARAKHIFRKNTVVDDADYAPRTW